MERVARELAVQYAAIEVLASATTIDEAARRIVAKVCGVLGWRAGALWLVDEDDGVIRCLATFAVAGTDDLSGVNAGLTFPPGIGLPGRVWSRREPVWIADVMADTNFPRRRWAERNRIHGAFAVPIKARDEVTGVLEFFGEEIVEPDAT